LILDDRAARGPSKLNAPEGRDFRRVEIVPGVEDLIAIEEIPVTMEFIRARGSSIFRGIARGYDGKLLYPVNSQIQSGGTPRSRIRVVVDGDSVDPVA